MEIGRATEREEDLGGNFHSAGSLSWVATSEIERKGWTYKEKTSPELG